MFRVHTCGLAGVEHLLLFFFQVCVGFELGLQMVFVPHGVELVGLVEALAHHPVNSQQDDPEGKDCETELQDLPDILPDLVDAALNETTLVLWSLRTSSHMGFVASQLKHSSAERALFLQLLRHILDY